MQFEPDTTTEVWGQRTGFIFGYFLFTTILSFALTLTHKIPDTWNYVYIMGITASIAVIGWILKRLLQ